MLLMFLILMTMIMIMMIMIMMIMIMTMTMMMVLLMLMILILMFVSNGRGTCYGDSGGPAIVRQPDGSYVQVFSQHHHHHCLVIIIYPMVLWSSLIGLLYKSRSFYFVRLEFSLLEHLLAAKRVTLVDR